MSRKIKNEQKKFLGETLNQYDKALDEAINQLDKKNREQNHKISSLINSFDNEFLEKDVEGNMTTLENSKDGMVIINEIQGSTEVNYCKDGEKELILNGDIDTQGESFVTLTEGVDGGLVDVSLEGNTEINLSKTKDPVLVTREFDDINCNTGKLQYTIDDVTTINDEPGKVDIDRIVGDTMVNHAVNGSEELILNAHINESGDNSIKLNGVTSDGGKVDVALEGNTLVNVSNVKDDYITPSIEDKVDQGSVISLPEVSEGLIHIDEIEGNTLVNYCTDGVKELTLNGDIDVEGTFVTTTEGVDNGLVDVMCEGNTLVNLSRLKLRSSDDSQEGDITLLHPLVTGRVYSLIFDTTSIANSKRSCFWLKHTVGDVVQYIEATENPTYSTTLGKHVLVFTATSDFEQLLTWFQNLEDGGIIAYDNIMLLEGDWTDKEIPQYFEGMKSVGQDDANGHKIEILSQSNLANIATSGNTNFRVANVKAGVSYSIKSTRSDNTVRYNLLLHDIDGNSLGVIKGGVSSDFCTFTPFKDGVLFFNAYIGNTLISDIMLVKGVYTEDTMPQFKPYTLNKKEILTNEPLRGLPSGKKDKIVKIGGKWFIERNVGCKDLVVTGGTNWEIQIAEGMIGFHGILNMGNNYNGSGPVVEVAENIVCDKLPSIRREQLSETTYDAIIRGNTYVGIIVKANKLETQDLDGFKKYINSLNAKFIYNLATPIYEPLEIEPTLNTYNDITHISNNSLIPCNMKIKNSGYNAIIKPSTLYTVAVDTYGTGTIGINLAGAEVTTTNNVATITTPSTLTDDSLRLYGKGIKASKVRLLEGDKTNWIPSFFEGMKSSFEDKAQTDNSYKIELLMNNKNLIDYNQPIRNNGSVHYEIDRNNSNIVAYSMESSTWQNVQVSLNLSNGKTYTLSYESIEYQSTNGITVDNNAHVNIYEGKPNRRIANVKYNTKNTTFTIPKDVNVKDLRIRIYITQGTSDSATIKIKGLMLTESNQKLDFAPPISNKIQLSSIEPLRGVNEIHDRLVFKDGKLMIERKCTELIINETNPYEISGNNSRYPSIIRLWYNGQKIQNYKNGVVLCDSLPSYDLGLIEGEADGLRGIDSIGIGYSNGLDIHLPLPTTSTLDEVRKYLKNNPLKVVHQLAEPTYEEIPYELQKIILESYANGTLFIDTNIPPTKVSFNCFEEELTYLYSSTSYTIQFISDRGTTADINLGGTQLLAQDIVQGLNRISITTPSELVDNKLIISGTGANISEVVVTDTNRQFRYFEGMKSVGECEELEITANNKNLWNWDDMYNQYGVTNPNVYKKFNGTLTKINDNEYSITPYQGGWYEQGIFSTPVYLKKGESLIFSGESSHFANITIYNLPNFLSPCSSIINNTDEALDDFIQFTINFTAGKDGYYVCRFWILNNKTAICRNIQVEKSSQATDYIPHQSNSQTLTHEPLRAVGDTKDRYVLIDGKWYIERRCGEIVFDGSADYGFSGSNDVSKIISLEVSNKAYGQLNVKSDKLPTIYGGDVDYDKKCIFGQGGRRYIHIRLRIDEGGDNSQSIKQWLQANPITAVYQLETPVYEPIDYNPFEVYSDTTHITTNSTIPCNLTVKNHGYNMVALKENTQYTLYVNKDTTNALTYRLGDYIEINSLSKFTFTTPATLTDKTLRIDSKGAKVNDLMLIEGTPTNDSIGYFDGLKSSYECEQVTDENDENYGKYKVTAKVIGKNLFDGKVSDDTKSRVDERRGILFYKDNSLIDSARVTDYIKVEPNTTIIYTGHNVNSVQSFAFYDFEKKYIAGGYGYGAKQVPLGACYFRVTFDKTLPFQVEYGDTVTEYEPYFESKQTIYLNSPLLKGDEIVWKDNKIQHYHKMGSIILDGSDDEKWVNNSNIDTINSKVFSTRLSQKCIKDDLKITSTTKSNLRVYTTFNSSELDCLYPVGSTLYVKKLICNLPTHDVAGFKLWLQSNPVTVVYQLETPYYEEISDYPLKLNVIANSSLSTESTIQVTNISFNIYEETLPYLYPNTKYYITFNADVDRNNIIIDLGGNHVVFDCKVGFNKVEITTPSDTTNLLTFSGTGVNIDHVKVTQQDIDEYFEGMKSVGECEELEITSANSDNSLSNAQQLTHEPLRGVGNVRDRYVLIDNKWYIERRCGEIALESLQWEYNSTITNSGNTFAYTGGIANILVQTKTTKNYFLCNIVEATKVHNHEVDKEQITQFIHSSGIALRISRDKLQDNSVDSLNEYLSNNNAKLVYQLATPVYEEIDYNPFEVYPDVTHITANSLIPTNVVVKNHGYNCILKPSTKYTIALNKSNGTISAKLGGSAKVDSTNSVFTITTPSILNDNILRLSGSGKVKDIMVLEGDKTINTPSYFEGIESVFEQEYDTEKGKYKVKIRVQNEDASKENYIEFYINEPLRGVGDVKDKVYVKDDKVVVERNCGSVTFDGSDDEKWDSNGIWKSFDNFVLDWGGNVINCICDKLPSVTYINSNNTFKNIPCFTSQGKSFMIRYIDNFRQWLQQNPLTVVYKLAESTYEEVDCDLSKLVLENYPNSSLIFESNIPVSANIRYSSEVPVVTQAKSLSSQVDNTTLDINENIIPYMCDIDYRIVELQLMNGDTQGEGIELLGIGDIEILGNENVLFNNREDKKYNFSYDMLKRDILSQRYSKEEYQYRLDRYLLANKISDEEYKELEGLLNNGE